MTKDLRKIRNKERLEFWSNHIKSWEESQLSQAEYCRQNNLQKQLMSSWKTKLIGKEEKESKKLVEVKLDSIYKATNDAIELIIKDKYKISIHSDFDQAALKRILSVLEE